MTMDQSAIAILPLHVHLNKNPIVSQYHDELSTCIHDILAPSFWSEVICQYIVLEKYEIMVVGPQELNTLSLLLKQ